VTRRKLARLAQASAEPAEPRLTIRDPYIFFVSHEVIGQLNTYVSWYAKSMRADDDNPPVGILRCTQKDQALAEYALAGMDNQLFVSKYQLHLPAREQLQRELERTLKEDR
jgi:YhcG PDDEXK nuclease domain